MVIPAAPTPSRKTDQDAWVRLRGEGSSEEQRSLALGWRVPFPKEGAGCVSFRTILVQEVWA